MRFALLLALVACQGRDNKDAPPPSPPADAGFVHPQIDARIVEVAPTNWDQCKKALEAAPKTPQLRRVQMIIGACKPCGEWKPLIEWSKAATEGGPTRDQIEDSMIACKAYCNSDAKMRFLGTLDKFRGKDTRGPWKFLGELCKEQISAIPDNRYASAPWFALDRIARAAGEKPELAPLLDAFDITLPVVSISGYGYDLAKSPVTSPAVGPLALTVTPAEIRIAAISTAKLTKDGIVTISKGELYPGALVKTTKELDAEAAKLDPGTPSVSIFAPHGMPAVRLLDALALTGERPRPLIAKQPNVLSGDVRLAVQASSTLPGWQVSGSIPVSLRTKAAADAIHIDLDDNPDPVIEKLKAEKTALLAAIAKTPGSVPLAIQLGPKATVEGLAKLLGAAVYFDVKSVALVKKAK